MQKKMWLDFPNSVSDIVARNKSFDACTIHVLYTGRNRNRTSISREAVEKAIPTLYNCPIVCNYNVEEDTIGGHDVEFVKTKDGVKMVNLTDAVGVIPEGAQYRWETYEDNSGTHDYLVVDGLLWKRSSAYDKLKRDEISGQSMEITVNDGKSVDGYFEIYDFDFTAFCILGEDIEPCFESADIETFSLGVYKKRFAKLMDDLKNDPSIISSEPSEEDKEFSLKGGEAKVNLTELMAKYGLTEADITFSTEEMSEEELEAKFAEIQKAKFAEGDDPAEGAEEGAEPGSEDGPQGELGGALQVEEEEEEPAEQPMEGGSGEAEGDEEDVNSDEEDDASTPAKKNNNFALMAQQLTEELCNGLSAEMYHDDYWNEDCRRYWYIDHDADASVVYAHDWKDCVICGFNYAMNGDHPVIDFASYKRKKVVFEDFDEGDMTVGLFSRAHDEMKAIFDQKMTKVNDELAGLKKFHDETVAEQRKVQEAEVFEAFADLSGNESFEALKANCADLTIDELNEKCFAIRGRNMKVTFSANQPAAVRLPVERKMPVKDDPYNGVFAKYGY